ncbi:thermonuclease family protein [Aspergillus udagawae]|uniref:Probable endonuclease LCL3 n=1 Tax=Aspergillus udagawae TaxID=91492 RepID=A0A8E0QZF4_9EURO|nr:putative endonuclease lcl3 [Aspergillus udagawae]GIC94164.1 putative endonuclease lcl3 [Aspergillus udagawae]
MRWPPWASDSQAQQQTAKHASEHDERQATASSPKTSKSKDWESSVTAIDWAAFTEVRTIIPTLILTSGFLGAFYIHRRYLRRFPDAVSITPSYFRRRSLLGQVTSVGDGDNFRIYHTPGGRLAGWGWLPWKKVPTSKKELRDKTVHIRLAGIDAPELAHFGRPEQPFAREAHQWLTSYLLNRRVRAYIHRPDQYQRAVASVYVRRFLDFPPLRRRDVSYEMLKRGLATVYEAKWGAEFGGEAMERRYKKAEWWAKLRGVGLWKDYRRNRTEWESPREYKTRMGLEDAVQPRAETKK